MALGDRLNSLRDDTYEWYPLPASYVNMQSHLEVFTFTRVL